MSPVEEEFSIVWKGHGGHLSECLEGLGADFSDVSLSCSGTGSSGGSISAHKLILASCSPYFHKIFREHPGQTQTLIILSDIPRDILLDLLTYMYQGSVSLSEKRVPLFLQAAKHLQIKGIGACEEPTAHQATNNLSILASAAALDGRLLEKQAPPSYRVPKYTCPSSHLPQEQENEEPTQPMDVLEEGASSLPISPPLLTIPDPHLFINNREPPKSPLLPNKILPSPPPEENGSASPAIKREDN
ncbi:Broadcomplex core protein isoforms 1/2/3/4/5like, partial [Caligus rogercresseyi]